MNYPQIIEHRKAVAVAIGGVGFILLGACLSIDGIDSAARWQAVDGTVTKAKINFGRRSRISSSATFEYQYHVAGKIYTSRSLDVGLFSGLTCSGSVDAVKNNPVGSKVIVYYNPRDPSRAALSTGIPLEAPVEVLIGLTMVAGACFYFKERQRTSGLLEEHFPLSWPSVASGGR